MGSIRRNLTIARCFGILWFLTILFYSYFLSNLCPSDDELIIKFNESQKKLNSLVEIIKVDNQTKRFYKNGESITFHSNQKTDKDSAKAYKRILKELDILSFYRPNKQTIYFVVWNSDKFFVGDKYKGFVYFNDSLKDSVTTFNRSISHTDFVDSTDDITNNYSVFLLRKINKNWHLYYDSW